jgi:hypothetical protein
MRNPAAEVPTALWPDFAERWRGLRFAELVSRAQDHNWLALQATSPRLSRAPFPAVRSFSAVARALPPMTL